MSSDIPAGIEVQKVWLAEARYTPEAAERRPAVRGQHLERMAALRADGTVIEAGAYADALTSSVILLHAQDEAAALAIVRDDVYVRSGVWDEITVRPFGRVLSVEDRRG